MTITFDLAFFDNITSIFDGLLTQRLKHRLHILPYMVISSWGRATLRKLIMAVSYARASARNRLLTVVPMTFGW